MKKSILLFFSFISIGLMLSLQGCNSDALYDKSYYFKDNVWNKKDTAYFKVEVKNTDVVHDYILSLRTSKEYQYNNLWLHIFITAPDGSTSKVAQMIPLANPDGSWIGKKSGTLVESTLRFDSKPFPLEGEYIFKITNATQQEEIRYVEDISLRID